MPDAIIENPILNSPFEEPRRHFKFTDDGITNEILETRRSSGYFVPIPQPKKRGKQLELDTQWTQDRFRESEFINRTRDRVKVWREQGWPGVTNTTAALLQYWTNSDRERKLFFCQIEAVETAIYLTEIADKAGDAWLPNELRTRNETANPGLYRIAFKMATGSGKTLVMGMLIAWQALNKIQNSQDARFSDSFLLVAPGITIRDRLRVLLPNDAENYYRQHDLVPPDLFARLSQARIVITNFHAFLFREKTEASKTTKAILSRGKPGLFTETPDEMVRRVLRELGTKKNIVVLNDEAHHCYHQKPQVEEEKLSADEKREAKKREEEARVWISGLEAIQKKIGVRAIYDLSATPFFLKGSGYSEGTLFPWVVSDFSLIDAIESGVVKIPRVPVADDSMTGDTPTYRDLWRRIRDRLPKKGRATEAVDGGPPHLPKELQGALHALYGHYEKARIGGSTPPVYIVVCNNTNVSKLVFDYVAGWEKRLAGGKSVVVPGELVAFSNEENGRWRARPNTILVDSSQLESGEAMSPEFKKMASAEIDEWKSEYRARFPGRDPEKLTDEDLLREVMNTVGKPGKLGEAVKCVVSVSMLTEGWDANTVTHILGVRAFGTQLLCEQVIGRGLRRMSYAIEENGRFSPEYAEVFGVPFSFIPTAGSMTEPKPGVIPTHVRALEDRVGGEIWFPRVEGYRFEVGDEPLRATFTEESRFALSTAQLPSRTVNAAIIGETTTLTLDDLKERRVQEVEFRLAKYVSEKYFRDKPWRFPEVLRITRRWLAECLTLKDNVFPQYLLVQDLAHDVADRIYRSIADSAPGEPRLRPILYPYDSVSSTRHVEFDTIRKVWTTRPDKCHVTHVVLDSDWEAKMAQSLEDMPEVLAYVKNYNVGFTIPYTLNDQVRQYNPDYIVRVDDGRGSGDPLNLIVEVTGEKKKDKEAKVETARRLWIPAINNDGRFGRWAFLEIQDPWNAQTEIRSLLKATADRAA
jgi:type III restriction enzyme